MAVYRFRVVFEDYDEILREVDVLSTHTFLDLHKVIQQSTGYKAELSSSFYISNDQWIKGDEIAYLPNERKSARGILLMESAKLNKYIDDPHQKFYYTYNFERPFDFHVQLIKIFKEESGKTYPLVSKSTGIAPKPFGAAIIPEENTDTKEEQKEDFDFLNEMEYSADDTEDMDLMDDAESTEEQSDEFTEEFGNNENFEEDY